MRPEDYIDENYVPTEADFAPETVDEKEELRKSIKMTSRRNTILYAICALIFALNGILDLCLLDSDKPYRYAIVTLFLISVIGWVFYAIVYHRIHRATTAKEMQHQLDLIRNDSLLSKILLSAMALCILIGLALFIAPKFSSYVTILIVGAVAVVLFGLYWLILKMDRNPRDEDIEKLLALEEKEEEMSKG